MTNEYDWIDGFDIMPGMTVIPESSHHNVPDHQADLVLTVSTGQRVNCRIQATLRHGVNIQLNLVNVGRLFRIFLLNFTEGRVRVTRVLFQNDKIFGKEQVVEIEEPKDAEVVEDTPIPQKRQILRR